MYDLFKSDEERFAESCECGCGHHHDHKHPKRLVPDKKESDLPIKVFDIFQFEDESGTKKAFLVTDQKHDKFAGISWHGYVDGLSPSSGYYRGGINVFETDSYKFSLDNPVYSSYKNRAWVKIYDDGSMILHKDNFQTPVIERIGFLTEDEIKAFKNIRSTCSYYEYRTEIKETLNNMCVGSVYSCKDEPALHVFIRREEEFFIFASIDGSKVSTYNIQPKMMNRMIKNRIFSYRGYIKPEEWLRFNRCIYAIEGIPDKDLDFKSLIMFERDEL